MQKYKNLNYKLIIFTSSSGVRGYVSKDPEDSGEILSVITTTRGGIEIAKVDIDIICQKCLREDKGVNQSDFASLRRTARNNIKIECVSFENV